jgi:hypothetical protein
VLTTGQRFKRFDQLRQRHFWSSYLFTPDANGYLASGEFDLFTTPPGQFGQGFPVQLTDRETNWRSANRVPDNQNFEILEFGVSLHALSSVVDDSAAHTNTVVPGFIANCFWHNSVLAVRYLTNSVELGLCQDFAQASGPTMGIYQPIAQGEPKVPTRYATNGFPGPGTRRRMKIPVLLQHGETFAMRILIPRSVFTANFSFVARIDFWATESFVEKS